MADSYEKALKKIETIVSQLESGELSLEESIKSYEQGLKLLKECYQKLNSAEKKLEELSGELDSLTVTETGLDKEE